MAMCMQATAAAVRQARSARGDKNAMEVAQTELHALSAWWSQPSAGAELKRDSYKVAFSCAVDAAIDSNFDEARRLISIGGFVREWAERGREPFLADLQDTSGSQEAAGRLKRLADEYGVHAA